MYYLKSRYYDPQVGRFINADGYASTGQGVLGNNMFAYCGNNFINTSDPSGHFSFWDIIDIGFAIDSICEFVSKPSWRRFGSAALDVVGLLPIVPSIGGAKKAVNAIDNGAKATKRIDTTVDTARTGWSVGDNINNLTRAGKVPSWPTVKSRYWKNEAALRPEKYSPEALPLMKKGRAPQVEFDGKFYPMELHHKIPRRDGGSNSFDNLLPLTPWDHDKIDPYRHFKP